MVKLMSGIQEASHWTAKKLSGNGYRFVMEDRNRVNAFFVDPECFDVGFLDGVKGLEFAENRYQYTKFRKSSEEQYKMIENQKFISL